MNIDGRMKIMWNVLIPGNHFISPIFSFSSFVFCYDMLPTNQQT